MCVWREGGGARGYFYVVVFNAIFSNSELNTKSFNRNWKNNILTRIFSYRTLKVNLCTVDAHNCSKIRDECLFCYFKLILFVCIDVLRRCQHFCSHEATFPGHLG